MKKRGMIILDLDNTCISAVDMNENFVPYKNIPYKKFENLYYIYERPGLQKFLTYIFKRYKVAVWTAAEYEYAMYIIKKFIICNDKNRVLEFVLWNSHCEYSENYSDQLKDLRLLLPLINDNDKIVLLDDNKDILGQDNTKQIYTIDSLDFDMENENEYDDTFLLNKAIKKINKICKQT